MTWRIAVDSGGTFTDVVALNEETGEQTVVKTASRPDDPPEAVLGGIVEVCEKAGVAPEEISLVLHGTTVATNAILEGKYAEIGLIVNRGFREMLEVARQMVPGDFGDITWWIKPPRVVPLERVREIEGRMNFEAEEIAPLDEEGIRTATKELRELGIEAIAVSLLHSYRDPSHEHRVREVILDEFPECKVSVSSDVIREYREYERTLSTCLNVGLMPTVSTYLSRVEDRLRSRDIESSLYVMKSSGGVASPGELVDRPIAAALSGPAAGAIGAAVLASVDGHEDVITLDMGGTSTDVALLENGAPRLLSEGKIDIYDLKTPMVDMTAVGAGGGSIAWLSAGGSLRVGPQSAGADPGPVCYGQGGEEPTITDANVLLGRISPYLLGGAVKLDAERAEAVIEEKIAAPLGLSPKEAAAGILEVAINTMAAAVRLVSVRRGRDPRHYALFAFGGAGGLHACAVAEVLGMSTAIVPPSPGATSAAGLLYSDVRVDHIVTHVRGESELDPADVNDHLGIVRERTLHDLDAQGFSGAGVRIEAFADLRYQGQGYEIRIPMELSDGAVSADGVEAIVAGFHRAHEDQYGYAYPGAEEVELVSVGVTGFGLLRRPSLESRDGSGRSDWREALEYEREMYSRADERAVSIPVYKRESGPIGVALPGPAVIEQYDSTVVLEKGWQATTSPYGQLLLTRN